MAKLSLSLFFVLAAAVAVAAISAQALTTKTPFSPIRFINRHQPPSVGKNLAPHSHHRHHHHHHHHHQPAAAPSPTNQGVALPPEPFPGFYKCLEKLSGVCGSEIYRGIFGQESVSARCCGQLVGMGRRCDKSLVNATLALPEMAKVDKKKIKERAAEIWSQCLFITNLQAGVINYRSPMSP